MRGEQAQANDQSLAQGLEVILVHARVDDIEEDGRDLSGTRERVLDGGILGQQLGGKVGVADVLVVRREGVAGKAEWADPKLATYVDLAADEESA